MTQTKILPGIFLKIEQFKKMVAHFADIDIFLSMRISFLALLAFIPAVATSQDLPWAVGNTYRSASNPMYWQHKKPYEGYWQQDVYYQIKAKLDDVAEVIDGEEKLVYYNNSPHTLTKAYFHLYQNAVQPGSLVDELYNRNHTPHEFGKYEAKNMGTTIDWMQVNGKPVKYAIVNTVMECELPGGLAPGDSCEFTMAFKTYFDRGSIRRRFKVYDHDGYKHFNGVHWYPRICVYDRKFTWETAQHMEHEFYGDYGAFDVELQLPIEYVNEATGVLQNPTEVYPGDLRQRLDISNFRYRKPNTPLTVPTARNGTWKSWKYHAENVHDFAWTADPTYRIGEIDWKGIKCIALAQENNAQGWQATDSFVAFVIATYSNDFGMYEYPKMVAADAADGMEYPMLTLDGGMYPSHQGLIAHEVGHNWFFGMLGNNETYRASLDEGFTQFLTSWCMKKAKKQFYHPNNVDYSTVYAGYMSDAIDGEDAVLNTQSDDFHNAIGHGGGYRHVYYKTATMLYNLQYVLGDSVFNAAMKDYVKQWKMCHPYVEDFRNAITMSAKTDLNWFFDEWFETTKYCDYAIKSVRQERNGEYNIRLHRKGDMVMPVDLRIRLNDGSIMDVTVPVSNYRKPGTFNAPQWTGWGSLRPVYNLRLSLPTGISGVVLDPSYRLADINRMNNFHHRLIGITFEKENGPERDYRTGYNLRWRPDFWYSYLDGVRTGVKLSGDYAARRHMFNLYTWYQSGMGRLDANNSKHLSYWFDYRHFIRKKGELDLGSRYLANLWIHQAGWEKTTESGGRFTMGLKMMQRVKSTEDYITPYRSNEVYWGYLPNQNYWSNGVNLSLNLGYKSSYSRYHNNGFWALALRTTTPWSDASYAYLRLTWQNNLSVGKKVVLRTRVFGQTGTGSNYATESALFASGANPEEIQDNKYARDLATYSISQTRDIQYTTLAYGGGLNLRGYGRYALPHVADGQVRTFYRGSNGASINGELDFSKLFGFVPKISMLSVNTYLFGDAGIIAYQNGSHLINSGLLADAGFGMVLNIQNWNKLTPKKIRPAMTAVNPLSIRFEIPAFLSAVQGGQNNLAFRWLLGINRAF